MQRETGEKWAERCVAWWSLGVGLFVRPVGEASGFYADVSESYSQDGPGLAKKFI